MKMIKRMIKGSLALSMVGTLAIGADINLNSVKNVNSQRNQMLGLFSSSNAVQAAPVNRGSGTTRWYLYGEGLVGGSYTMLGDKTYKSIDVGYSTYISTVPTANNLTFFIGTEIRVPIYLGAKGPLTTINENLTGPVDIFDSNTGWGIEVPLMLGFSKNNYYFQGMIGYSYQNLKDKVRFRNVADPLDPSLRYETTADSVYQGLVYGGGFGARFASYFTFGLRYMYGDLKNTTRTIDYGTGTSGSFTKYRDFTEKYHRISAHIGIIF